MGIKEFRYVYDEPGASRLDVRQSIVGAASIGSDEVRLSILPPGPIDDLRQKMTANVIDINTAPAPTMLAKNSDKPVEIVAPNDSFGFIEKGTDLWITTNNPAPCLLLEFDDDVKTRWLASADIDRRALDPLADYKIDPAVGSFARVAMAVLTSLEETCGTSDILTIEAAVLGISARVLGALSSQTMQGAEAVERLSRHRNAAQLVRSVDYALTNLSDQNLKIADMAEQAGISPCYFGEVFKNWKGITPYAFIKMERVKLAAQRLGTSNLPIAAIAHDAGFSSQAHLTTAFKAAYGITPAKYRAEIGLGRMMAVG